MRNIIIYLALILIFSKASFAQGKYKIGGSNVDSIVVVKYDDKKIILRKTIINKDSIAKVINRYINRNKSVYIIKARPDYGLTIYYHDGHKNSMSILDKYFNPDTDGWHKMRKNVIKYVWGYSSKIIPLIDEMIVVD